MMEFPPCARAMMESLWKGDTSAVELSLVNIVLKLLKKISLIDLVFRIVNNTLHYVYKILYIHPGGVAGFILSLFRGEREINLKPREANLTVFTPPSV